MDAAGRSAKRVSSSKANNMFYSYREFIRVHSSRRKPENRQYFSGKPGDPASLLYQPTNIEKLENRMWEAVRSLRAHYIFQLSLLSNKTWLLSYSQVKTFRICNSCFSLTVAKTVQVRFFELLLLCGAPQLGSNTHTKKHRWFDEDKQRFDENKQK